jgi:hypothetical protein
MNFEIDVYDIHLALTKAIDSYGGIYSELPVFDCFEKEFNAEFKYLPQDNRIPISVKFNTEEDFTWFMLRWA